MLEIKYANDSDFDYIYKLSNINSDLLGYIHPIEIRDAISENKLIIALYDNNIVGFCIFNPLKKRPNLLTIFSICVDLKYRGNKIATQMIQFIKDMYKRDIKATCVKDSDSEKFWSKIAIKYEELPGKKRPICRYIIYNNTIKLF